MFLPVTLFFGISIQRHRFKPKSAILAEKRGIEGGDLVLKIP